MPSTTKKGVPYPLGTDRVMDGDDAIKALAEAVDSGKGAIFGSVNVAAAGVGAATTAVVFPTGVFGSAPIVVATINGAVSGSASAWFASATGITAAGFNANILHRDGTAATATLTVGWIAVGP